MRKNIKSSILIFVMMLLTTIAFCGCSKAPQSLELSKTKIELLVGESQNILVNNPDSELEYTFQATNDVITVSQDGNITANKIGASCVVVSSSIGQSGVCVVVVYDTKPVELNGLTITNNVASLNVGDSLELGYSKNPVDADNYNAIKWSSSNSEVASIDANGLLVAHKPGDVVITLTATGTNINASINLKVVARESTLSLVYDDVTGLVGVNDLKLSATLFTDYDEVTIIGYTSSNPDVATVDEEGNVKFLRTGKTIITYKVTCGPDSLEASCKVAVIEKEGYKVIRTPEQLQAIGNKSGNYMLGNDIDLLEACSEGGSLYYAGQGFMPLFNVKAQAFSGVFDGMGYSIKNLYINRNSTAFVSLFSYINVNKGSEGIIQNLALEGGKIIGGNYVSSFIGSYNGSGSEVAGLKNCWTNIEIESRGQSCGGLVAYNASLIENCYSLSKISGVGTLSSVSHNTVANSLLGVKGTFVCSDYQPDINQLVNPSKLNGTIMEAQYKTFEEMCQASLYAGWDLSVWNIVDGSLPTLKTAND